MSKTILERFSIPETGSMDDYNLIGLDFGDGEISAAYAEWDALENKVRVGRLHLDRGATLQKNPNAYYVSQNLVKLITDVEQSETDELKGADRYYNFKRCPGTVSARETYIFDDRERSPYRCETLMGKGFNCAVNDLFYNNYTVLDPKKPTIIFVGRPSGVGWETHEQDYVRLLQEYLRLPEAQAPVYIAIQSESSAALAHEINRSMDRERIQKDEIVIVLDNGSSTFDITVITPDGIPKNGEDSFQFGGNQLDEALLAYARGKFQEANPNHVTEEREQKLSLRMLKEAYYGKNGKSQKTQTYEMHMVDENHEPVLRADGRPQVYEFRIDYDSMQHCLNQMPVDVTHIDEVLDGRENKTSFHAASWLDGCRLVYQQFYDKMRPFFKTKNPGGDRRIPVVPDRVILTGGVSVMPEVQKAVEEIFGVTPKAASHPNYSVSEGLAYVLGTEFRKREYLEELFEDLKKSLPDAASLREELIEAGVQDNYHVFETTLKRWAEDECPALSLKTWDEQHFHEEWYNLPDASARNLSLIVIQGGKNWLEHQDVQGKVSHMLKVKFAEMFPDYTGRFSCQWENPPLDSLRGVRVTINIDFEYFFDLAPNNISVETPLDSYTRQKLYQTFVGKRDGVQNGGSCTHREVVGRWFFGKPRYRNVTHAYGGFRAPFTEKITVERAGDIRREILALMRQPLKDYVESITPYFHMTVRREQD